MRLPAILFGLGLVVFASFAGGRLRIHSNDNHFVYLADAFLHGQAELVRKPHHQNDWAQYKVLELRGKSAEKHGAAVKGFFSRRPGKPNEFRLLDGTNIDIPRGDRGKEATHYFVSFPPFPAVLMMPLVAATGHGANDVVFTVIFAALNVVLIFLLLERLRVTGHSERPRGENLWLVALLAFGSAHLWCAVLGQVWFTALIVGVTLNLLYIYFALDARRPFLAGLCLAAGFATRTPLLFACVFFYLQLFWPSGARRPRRELLRAFLLFSTPCVVVGVALLAYNQVRFGSVFEFGHTYLYGGTIPRIRDFGLFHEHFLTRNLTALLTLIPRLSLEAPYLQISKHGMSILVATPALAYVLWPRRSSPLARAMGITAACVATPILFYQNTGWEQYGYRFALDFLPYLICCLALGGRAITPTFRALVVAGVLVNAFGAVTFKRKLGQQFYGDFMAEEPVKKAPKKK